MSLLERMSEVRQARSGKAGRSTSSNMEVLILEAKLAAEGRAENYHVPKDSETLQQVQKECRSRELAPAWVVVDDIQ